MSSRTHWQSKSTGSSNAKKFGTDSPNLVAGLHFLLTTLGWLVSLGILGRRAIRGGSSPSSHWFGAAADVRYYTDPTGVYLRSYIDAEIRPKIERDLALIIANADVLGIQQIHDYYGDRIWKCDRDPAQYPTGWKAANGAYSGMGERWATYCHFETNEAEWGNDTPWDARIGLAPVTADDRASWPIFDPERNKWGLWPFNGSKPQLRNGSRGDAVLYAQAVLRSVSYITQGQVITPGPLDGRFGPQTERGVLGYQAHHGLVRDGVIGPQTWAQIDSDAGLISEAVGS